MNTLQTPADRGQNRKTDLCDTEVGGFQQRGRSQLDTADLPPAVGPFSREWKGWASEVGAVDPEESWTQQTPTSPQARFCPGRPGCPGSGTLGNPGNLGLVVGREESQRCHGNHCQLHRSSLYLSHFSILICIYFVFDYFCLLFVFFLGIIWQDIVGQIQRLTSHAACVVRYLPHTCTERRSQVNVPADFRGQRLLGEKVHEPFI